MNKNVLKKTIKNLENVDIREIVTFVDDSGLFELTMKPPYFIWIDILNDELGDLGIKKVFLEYFYLWEIDLPDNSSEEEVYNKLDELLKCYLNTAEELVKN